MSKKNESALTAEEQQLLENNTKEELYLQIKQLAQAVTNKDRNQQALIKENEQLRSMATESGDLIYRKLLAVKKDLEAIGKNQENEMQGWKFRGIDDLLNAMKPLMDKHGVGVLVNTAQFSEPKFQTDAKGKVTKHSNVVMKYTFFAEDGSSVECTVPAEAVDRGDKGTAKALSAALKYCLIQAFVCPTEDVAEGDREIVDLGKAPEEDVDPKSETQGASEDTPAPKKKVAKKRVSRKASKEEDEIPAEKKSFRKKSFRKSSDAEAN